MKLFIVLFHILTLLSCNRAKKAEIEVIKIDSQKLIDSLTRCSDTTFTSSNIIIFDQGEIQHQITQETTGAIVTWHTYKNDIVKNQRKFYSNGQLFSKLNFNRDGTHHGVYKFYYPNGLVKMKGEHENGKELTEKRVMYDEDGNKIEKE